MKMQFNSAVNNSIILLITLFGISSCQAQTNFNMKENINPLLCDPVEGFCEIPGDTEAVNMEFQKIRKPVKVVYFTDPICSSCWAIEPQLRKLKLEYGNELEIEYRMGGLLPDWSYNSGGISKPSDVAHHWDEVSVYYDMPIVGDVWLEDPLNSSYPPSVAFKAAQLQDENKAILFMRIIREMVFLQKKNISKSEILEEAARLSGLNMKLFREDIGGKAKELFQEDLNLARQSGVRGFPTILFTGADGITEKVYGSKPYDFYSGAVLKVHPEAIKNVYDKNPDSLFRIFPSLTAKEFSILAEMPREAAEELLNELTLTGKLEKFTTRNGSVWKSKKLKN